MESQILAFCPLVVSRIARWPPRLLCPDHAFVQSPPFGWDQHPRLASNNRTLWWAITTTLMLFYMAHAKGFCGCNSSLQSGDLNLTQREVSWVSFSQGLEMRGLTQQRCSPACCVVCFLWKGKTSKRWGPQSYYDKEQNGSSNLNELGRRTLAPKENTAQQTPLTQPVKPKTVRPWPTETGG